MLGCIMIDTQQALANLGAYIQATPKRKFVFSSAIDLVNAKTIGWRVLNVIPKKGLVVMWGAAGSGKSFAAYELSASIARGVAFNGKRVKKGLVLYIAAEGNLSSRTKAYLQENDLDPHELENLRVLVGSVNMLNSLEEQQDLIDAINLWRNGQEVAMVVFDTLNRVLSGGNENSSEDMGAFIRNVKEVEDTFNCATLVLHHSGKDATKGSRGHSSLLGAMDAEISIARRDDIRTFRIEKQKDADDYFDLFNFKLKKVDLGAMSAVDPDAEPHERLSSCVIEATDQQPIIKPPSKGATLFQLSVEESVNGAKEDVKAIFYKKHNGSDDAKKKAFNRAWKSYMNELIESKK